MRIRTVSFDCHTNSYGFSAICSGIVIASKIGMSKFHLAILRRLVQRCDFVWQTYETLRKSCDFVLRQAVAWLLYDWRKQGFNINRTLLDLEHSCNGKQPWSEYGAEWLGIYFGVNPFATRPTGFSKRWGNVLCPKPEWTNYCSCVKLKELINW